MFSEFMHPIYQAPEDLSALLQACYDVADVAHKNMVRTKKNGDIPYITHPTIVYKLLRLVGVEDEFTLAAAFLHDTMEDYEPFKTPGALQNALAEKFLHANIPDAEQKAYIIASLCEELTNAEHMPEGKRGWQWEHGQKLSPRAKLVKISDQAASLVDDILLPSDRPYEKIRKFNMKALECVKACAGENDLLEKLFKTIFTDAMIVMDGEKAGDQGDKTQAAQAIRQTFSLEGSLKKAQAYPAEKHGEIALRHRQHPGTAQANTGLIQLGVSHDNQVHRFFMLVDPHLDEDSARNKPIIEFMQSLETTSPFRVTYQPLTQIDGRVVREFKLKPGMELGKFIGKARESSAIDERFATLVQTHTNSTEAGFSVP